MDVSGNLSALLIKPIPDLSIVTLHLSRLAQALDHFGRYSKDMKHGQPASGSILQLPFEISDGVNTRCAVADRRDNSHVLHLGSNWLVVQEPPAMEDKLILAFHAFKQLQPRLIAGSGPPSLLAPGADRLPPKVHPGGDISF